MKRTVLLLAMLTLFSVSLTACTPPRQIVKTEYIRQQVPPLPAVPEYYSVKFKSVEWAPGQYDYCLDPGNAKNLLKNKELDKGYQEEMRDTLTQLKGQQ